MKRARSIVWVLVLASAVPACGGGSAKSGDGAAGGSAGNDAAVERTAADAPADQKIGMDLAPARGDDGLVVRDGAGDTAAPADGGGDAFAGVFETGDGELFGRHYDVPRTRVRTLVRVGRRAHAPPVP